MSTTQSITTNQTQLWGWASAPICIQKIQNLYFEVIKGFIETLQGFGMKMVSRIFSTFLAEPLDVLYSIYYKMWRWVFSIEYLDPLQITAQQATQRATLFIHGNYHDPSAWIPLAQKLGQQLPGPMYCVQLNSGDFVQEDLGIIHQKIEEIKAQYQAHEQDVIIDIIGHSRGTDYALAAALVPESVEINENAFQIDWTGQLRAEIGKIIRIGTPTTLQNLNAMPERLNERLFEIDAYFDLLVPERSDSPRAFTTATGHLGLLYANEVYDKVIEWKRA